MTTFAEKGGNSMAYASTRSLVAPNYQASHRIAQPLQLPTTRAQAAEQADVALGFGVALIGFGLLLKLLLAR